MSLFFFIFVVMLFNWLSLVTGFFYIVLGIAVIIYKFLIVTLEPNVAYSLGGVLILYGSFRIFRAIDKFRKEKNED